MKINEFPELTQLSDNFLLLGYNTQNNTTGGIKLSTLKSFFGSVSTPVEVKLIGTTFGASPPYAAGSDYTKAFDGNLATFYDYLYSSGGYCGIDLGASNTKKLSKIRIYPRQDSGAHTRSGGAKIQGSNTSETSGFIDLFIFVSTPNTGIWYEGTVSISTAYRYLRYYGVDGTYCNIGEVEFYGS